jgi:5-methylcytosine-specific restriction endonuclease McrA
MVVTNSFNILINNNNVKHYNKKGYQCVSGDNIIVKWEDAPSYTKIQCVCDKCSKNYIAPKSVLLTQKHKGLCKSCSSQQSEYTKITNLSGQKFGKLLVIELHNNIPGKEKYWKCLCDCGNEKITTGRSLKTNKTTSCGCYHKEVMQTIIIPKLIKNNKKRTGENHPNWDPTKSNKERYKLRKFETNILREKTFKKDNYTCQYCLQKGGILNAHHILLFSKHVNLRYNSDNLTTLCYKCHIAYHSKYKKNINQETLNEFKKEVNFGL